MNLSGQRAQLWAVLENTYLPHRRYLDTPHAGSGRMWQLQRHIYVRPFYYIDYGLALTGALQLWGRARRRLVLLVGRAEERGGHMLDGSCRLEDGPGPCRRLHRES